MLLNKMFKVYVFTLSKDLLQVYANATCYNVSRMLHY